MHLTITGTGDPLVLVPGIQGRWELMRRAVDALAQRFRVITFPLCGDRASGLRFAPELGIDNYAAQIARAMDEAHVERAVVCGVSFGGLGALRFAATLPARTTALVLASTPGPGWKLKRRHSMYARVPWLFGPVFALEVPFRLRSEVRVALPARADRWRFTLSQLGAVAQAPISFRRMAERARLIGSTDIAADCSRVTSPTLVLTGEPALDHVVPVDGSSAYGALIRGARVVVLEGTGHLGSVTRPHRFAAVLEDFVRSVNDAGAAA